jgi:cobalamin biosynthesis Co2+ chelatase CbiK
MKKNLYSSLIILLIASILSSCNSGNNRSKNNNGKKKTGVLLVNHGSRSDTWRSALLELEKNVKDSILHDGTISGIKTAFMEYNEPSIATRLKEFDKEDYTDVVIVPVFLTVSTHSFDDIPTLIGQKDDPKSIELFKIEKMERYTPKANVKIAPLLDFTDILKKNVLRRFNELSKNKKEEGLVLIAYGDKTYNAEWSKLMQDVGEYVKQNTGITQYGFGWCGHIAHYSPDSTTFAVSAMLQQKKTAVVIPILVAFDETFQLKIIGGGIDKIAQSKEKVLYRPDAILPDKNVEEWIVATSKENAKQLIGSTTDKK